MSVVVVTPPESIVSLDLVKKHLRVDTADDDDLIAAYLDAAIGTIDGPQGWLGRAIGVQTLELRLEGFHGDHWRSGAGYVWDLGGWAPWARRPRIALPCPPLISIESIVYEDGAGSDQVLTAAGWRKDDGGVEPGFGGRWPSGRVAADAVRIQYQAGYETVPGPIRSAVLLMVGDLYENRSANVVDARVALIQNPTVENLLSPYRIWKI